MGYCFEKGDLQTECLSGDHGSGSGHHGSGSGDHGSGSGSVDHGSGSGDHGSGSGDHGSGSGDHGSESVLELVGGAGPHEGNIMISGRPVCDHGQNPVPEDDFAMNDVHCNGTEGYIWRCPHENSINQPINCTREEGMG